MNQTFDSFFQFHESSVVGQVDDLAFQVIADSMLAEELGPDIRLHLLQAQRKSLLHRIDFEYPDINPVTFLDVLGWIFRPLAPAQIADMDQAVNSFLNFDKHAEIGEVLHTAMMALPTGYLSFNSIQGFGSVCFNPSEILLFVLSMFKTTASTQSLIDTIFEGCFIFSLHDISEIWIKPSTPFSNSTNAP